MIGDNDYGYGNALLGASHAYLLPHLARILDTLRPLRAFEVGCGNGSVAYWLSQRGIPVTGIDPSQSGIEQGKTAFPHLELAVGSAYDDLAAMFFPRKFASTVFSLLEPGGTAVISTPYHGYWKNLALALSGKLDAHFTALWDGGHIKFWSIPTLTRLLTEAGFRTHQVSANRAHPCAGQVDDRNCREAARAKTTAHVVLDPLLILFHTMAILLTY